MELKTYLSSNKNLFPGDDALGDSVSDALADLLLIAVHRCCVDVAVPFLYGPEDCVTDVV